MVCLLQPFKIHYYRHHPKQKGPKVDAARHTQELREFIEQKRQEQKKSETSDSGVNMSVSSDEDEGQEIIENSSDLESEGIEVSNTKGKSTNKVRFSWLPKLSG